MKELSIAIKNAGTTKQKFADLTKISYYRIASILYGLDSLSDAEKHRIKNIFGNNIFLPSSTRNV
jgi:hypothetical protein